MEKYSVLMCVYRGDNPEWMKMAIDSMLNQTLPPDEFVIFKDGGLTEELNETLEQYVRKYSETFRIYGHDTNTGAGLASNHAIHYCQNEYIARMDADDISMPDRVEKQLSILSSDSNYGAVGCWVNEFSGSIENVVSRVILPESHNDIAKYAKRRCPVRHPALVLRKSAVLNSGNYSDMRSSEEYDLVVRMMLNGVKIYNIPKVYYFVRVDDNFYKRRGISMLRDLLHFRLLLVRMGFCSFLDSFISFTGQLVVMLLPNSLRKMFYKKFLRK